VPAASVVATNNVRLPQAVNPAGDEPFVPVEYVVLKSFSRYGVCARRGDERSAARSVGSSLRIGNRTGREV
jgi:hypothetical protein